MKIKKYGIVRWTQDVRKEHLICCLAADGSLNARAEYIQNRMNGDWEGAMPIASGRITWIKGVVKDDYVYGVSHNDGKYEYEVRYDESPKDRAWMEEHDRMYLVELVKTGKLYEKEPDVWRLLQMDEEGKRLNVGDWWVDKMLKDPDIGQCLRMVRYNYSAFCAERTRLNTKQMSLGDIDIEMTLRC